MTPISATCEQIAAYMEQTWQRLPISKKFTQPIPLAATVRVYRGPRIESTERFADVETALRKSIERGAGPVWLTARPGGGKTSALRWLARQLARDYGRQDELLPVYVDLGQVGHEIRGATWTAIRDYQLGRQKPIDYRPFRDRKSQYVHLVDGVDLLPQSISARSFLAQVFEDETGPAILASRRDPQVDAWLNDWPQTVRVELGALNSPERLQWLKDNCSEQAQAKFYSVVSANRMVETLLDIPLIFAMTASACVDADNDSEFVTDAFSGRTGIFSGFVQYSIERAMRDGRLPAAAFSAHLLALDCLGPIALRASRLGHYDRFPTARLPEIINTSLFGETTSLECWNVARPIALAAGLIEETPSQVLFLHQQFAEYLAGRALSRPWGNLSDWDPAAEEILTFRDLDAISVHALAVLAKAPHAEPRLKEIFSTVSRADMADACELFSATGAPEVVPFITPVPGNTELHALAWLAAITALGKLPHERSLQALDSVIRRHAEYPETLVRAAIRSLADFPLTMARGRITELAGSSDLPDWLRIAALLAGGELPTAQAISVASRVLMDQAATEDQKADAIDAIAGTRHPSALEIIKQFASNPNLSTALLLNADAAISRFQLPHAASSRFSAIDDSMSAFSHLKQVLSVQTKSPPNLQRTSKPMVSPFELNGDPTDLEKFIASLVGGIRAVSNSAESQQALLQICGRHPESWQLISAQPDFDSLPMPLLASCARLSGRRFLSSVPRPSAVPPAGEPPADSKQRLPQRKRQKHAMSREEVVMAYLVRCNSQGDSPTIAGALAFASKLHSPWCRSSICATKAWRETRKALEKTERQSRRARQSPSDDETDDG